MATETDSELIKRLVSNGGYVLVVGGGVEDLPDRFKTHPQIQLWDDNRPGVENRSVPMNTRVILWNRWIGVKLQKKLADAAKAMKIVMFPNLKDIQIKELLKELVYAPQGFNPLPIPVAVVSTNDVDDDPGPGPANPTYEVETSERFEQEEQVSETTTATPKKGQLTAFVLAHVNKEADFTKTGSIAREGERLYKLAGTFGISTTLGSVTNLLGSIVRKTHPTPRRKAVVQTTKPTTTEKAPSRGADDFEDLELLVADAVKALAEATAALKLVKEQLPKMRKDAAGVAKLRERLRKELGL